MDCDKVNTILQQVLDGSGVAEKEQTQIIEHMAFCERCQQTVLEHISIAGKILQDMQTLSQKIPRS